MSFFSGLDTEAYDRQYTDRQLLVRMARYFAPYRSTLFVITAMLIVLALTGAVAPVIVGRSIDLLSEQADDRLIGLIFGAVLFTGLINWAANWLRRRLAAQAVGDVTLSLRQDAFSAAMAHDLSFYDTFSSGRVVSRITSDTQDFGQVVVLITDLLSQIVQSLILAAILLRTEWRLALLLFTFLPVVFFAAIGFRALARRTTRHGMRAMGNVNAAIKETIGGIAIAKNFRQESSIYREFDESNQQSYKVNVRRGFVLSLVFPSLNALSGIGSAILVYAGGQAAASGWVSAGAWYLFVVSLERFWFPVLNLSAFWAQIQAGLSAAERVFALIDAESAVRQNGAVVPQLLGEITFEQVCFRYSDKETVLENFNLHIQAGESVALVGHTGAGKSSIAKLVARFYEFQSGSLQIAGQDIRSFDLRAYRSQLGIVSQTPFLFAGSVLDNIRYARPETSEDEILSLARQIGDGEWLQTLPNGLQTEVGERGARLSMGQRQLVALMRVLVQRPAIFILDEATASIDPFTERQIQQALNLILHKTTSILIAHRLFTVRAADRIIVLSKGSILEEGNHNQLLQQGGHYAGLYQTYFRHQSLAYIEQSRQLAND